MCTHGFVESMFNVNLLGNFILHGSHHFLLKRKKFNIFIVVKIIRRIKKKRSDQKNKDHIPEAFPEL